MPAGNCATAFSTLIVIPWALTFAGARAWFARNYPLSFTVNTMWLLL